MITCTNILGAFFVRQGDTSIRLEESEAIALKRYIKAGLVLNDSNNQIELTEEDIPTLTNAIGTLQKQKAKRRRAARRFLWN